MPALTLPGFPFSSCIGWSASRSECFASCKRKYYFQYYGKCAPEHLLQQIDSLRKLSSLPMVVGSVVHDLIADILKRQLRSSEPIDQQRFAIHRDRRIDEALESTNFMEVHYDHQEAPKRIDLLPNINSSVHNFLASDRYKSLRILLQQDAGYLIEPPGFGESRIDDLKFYAKVDCLVQQDGRTLILDWKTGRKQDDKYQRQLLGYAAWAMNNLKVPAEQIWCTVAYLQPEYQEVTSSPSLPGLLAFTEVIRKEIRAMETFTEDPLRNRPKSIDQFPLTANTNICCCCQFRELCNRDPTTPIKLTSKTIAKTNVQSRNLLDKIREKIDKEIIGIEKRDDLSLDQKVSQIIHIFSATCAATATQPLPFADIMILTPVQAYMGSRISAIRGMPISEASAKDLLKEISGAIGIGMLAQQAALGLYKCGLPFLAGFTTIPLVYGLTYAIGRTMDYYLQQKARGRVLSKAEMSNVFEQAQREADERRKQQK